LKHQELKLEDPQVAVCGVDAPQLTRAANGLWRITWLRDGPILFALFLLAVGVRVGLEARTGLGSAGGFASDPRGIYSEAVGLVEGRGLVGRLPGGGYYTTAFNMPLPSVLLACGLKVLGTSGVASQTITIGFASLSAPLVFLIAGTIMPRRWAVLAGSGCAIHPGFLHYSTTPWSETFYAPLLLLATLLSVRAIRRPGFATALVDGTAWGLAALCRPHALPAAILFAIGLGWTVRSRRPALGVILGTVLVMTPWLARNIIVFGSPVLLCLEGGETLLGSNNPYVVADPDLAGMWVSPVMIPEYRDRILQSDGQFARSRLQTAIAIDYLKGHPDVIPGLIIKKWVRWLTPVTRSGGRLFRVAVLCSSGGLLTMVIIGLVSGKIRYAPLLVSTMAITLTEFAVVAVYWGNLERGRIPLELTWLPWGVESFRQLVATPIAAWYHQRMSKSEQG
jgi:hypothetical protein